MKPGYKTTEFWLTLAAVIAAAVQNMLLPDSPAAQIGTAILAGLAALGYTASRGLAKQNDIS